MMKNFLIKNILTSGSKESSIRLTMLWGMLISSIILLSLSFIIIYCSIYDKNLDWSGMSLFMGALSTFMGVLIYGKVNQKKQEVYESINSNDNINEDNIFNTRDKYNSDLSNDITDDRKMNNPPNGKVI
jgi:hypothetical protein